MKKKFEFVPRSEYSPYLQRSFDLLKKVTNKLKGIGIQSKFYTVGSGKHHLITRCIENNQKQPFDLDFNLEIDIETLPKKFKDLNFLKETIRCKLNETINLKDCFKDGQDSTSVITVPLLYKDSEDIKFSFDIAIVSKNKNGDFQRLIRNKKIGNITWSQVQKSNDIESKIKELKSKKLWNKVRKTYLELKNNPQIKEPSFVCRIIAINNVYNKDCSQQQNRTATTNVSISSDLIQKCKKLKKADEDTKGTYKYRDLIGEVNRAIEKYKKGNKNYLEKAISFVYNRSFGYSSGIYDSYWNPYSDPVGDSAEDD